jgi:methyltransferase-like protein 6
MADVQPPAGPTVYAPYGTRRVVSTYWAGRYEQDAAKNWDLFYRRHADRFFKDRHYLAAEWPVLDARAGGTESGAAEDEEGDAPEQGDISEVQRTVSTLMGEGSSDGGHDGATGELLLLEAGCGVGNTLFPLLRANPRLRCFGVDFADAAIAIVRRHPFAQCGRVSAAVGDLTCGRLPAELAPCLGACDVATLMFVLSAISPERMRAAVDAAASALREGGLLLVRDYAEGDGAQKRLSESSARRPKQLDAAGRFFVRQDGTRAYYFALTELRDLIEGCGFVTERCEVVLRSTTNRAKALTIERRYVVGTFRRAAVGTFRRGAQDGASVQDGASDVQEVAADGFSPRPPLPISASRAGEAAPTAARATALDDCEQVRPSSSSASARTLRTARTTLPPTEGASPTAIEPLAAPPVTTGAPYRAHPVTEGAEPQPISNASWSEAKAAVVLALETALGPHATAAQRRRMLEELLEMLTQETEGGVHRAEKVKEDESVF